MHPIHSIHHLCKAANLSFNSFSTHFLRLLTLNRSYQTSLMLICAKFTQIDTLPCPGSKSPVLDRNSQVNSDGRALDMSWHVIWTLISMDIEVTFRNHSVQRRRHICSNIGVTILIESDSSRSVLEEKMQKPNLVLSQLGQRGQNLICDQVAAF